METPGLFGATLSLLERAMTLRSARHGVLASNAANMDTPNFKAFDVLVEEELQKSESEAVALRRTRPDHLTEKYRTFEAPAVRLMPESGYTSGIQGNTVDIDQVMTRLAENSLQYSACAEILARKVAGLKSAIQGGGR